LNSTGILMFVKYPEAGKVKTRLAKDVGDTKACQIYSRFVKECFCKLQNLNCSEPTIYFSPAEHIEEFKSWLGAEHHYLAQCEGDLTARLKYGVSKMFEQYKSVIAIGTDSPDLPSSYIVEAITALNTHDCVIGPCKDGGYYLIGLSKFQPEVFDDIDWSTEKVFEQTIKRFKQHNLTCHELPVWYDIDTVDALNFYMANNNIEVV